jgi:AcrR family transcriptional regulator
MSPRPRQGEQTQDLSARILPAAWQQIAQSGAPALSLRAIARSLGITAPAIYNYYPDRDALVTALIVDAFNSFADVQAAALEGIPATDYLQRILSLGIAYRQWAVEHPERYHLIFGTPIAGYNAPVQITLPAAARALAILVSELDSAYQAGKLNTAHIPPMSASLSAMFTEWQAVRGPTNELALYQAICVWSSIHGLVFLEISRQFPPFITDTEAFCTSAIQSLICQTILDGK